MPTTATIRCEACLKSIRGKFKVLEGPAGVLMVHPDADYLVLVNAKGLHVGILEDAPGAAGRRVKSVLCTECGKTRIRQGPYRSSRGWRRLGYRPMFRSGTVLMVATGEEIDMGKVVRSQGISGHVLRTQVDRGVWMVRADLSDRSKWEELDPSTEAEIYHDVTATLLACYCDPSMDGCDFCNGLRPAPGLEGRLRVLGGRGQGAGPATGLGTGPRDVLADHVRAKGLADEAGAQ